MRKVLAGCTSRSNAGGKGSLVFPAGIIQLVVGMMSWKAGDIMKSRNRRASSFSSDVRVSPATSIWM